MLVILIWKALFFTDPEKKPPELGEHGFEKSAWTTVCTEDEKTNSTTSPVAAWTVSGLKTFPPSPTLMVCVAARAAPAKRELPAKI